MKQFVLGVAVGAVGMGLYTGHIQINIDRLKDEADRLKDEAEKLKDEVSKSS